MVNFAPRLRRGAKFTKNRRKSIVARFDDEVIFGFAQTPEAFGQKEHKNNKKKSERPAPKARGKTQKKLSDKK